MATIETVFWVIYAFYATFNGLLTSVAYGDFGEREATLANIANTGCIITECAVINLTGYSRLALLHFFNQPKELCPGLLSMFRLSDRGHWFSCDFRYL